MPTCKHSVGSLFRCGDVTAEEARALHSRFYETKDKQLQDALIVKCATTECKRPSFGATIAKAPACKMYVPTDGNVSRTRVCLKAFCSILRIGQKRVRNLTKYFQTYGRLREERRGGSRPNATYDAKTDSVTFCNMSAIQVLSVEFVYNLLFAINYSVINDFAMKNGLLNLC